MNLPMALRKIYRLINMRGVPSLVRVVISAGFDASRKRRFVIKKCPGWQCGYQIQWCMPTKDRVKIAFYRKLGQVSDDVRRSATVLAETSEEVLDFEATSTILLAGQMALADDRIRRFLLSKAAAGKLQLVYPDDVDIPQTDMVTVLTGMEANAEGRACLLRLHRLGIACDWLSTSSEVALEEVPLREACTRQAIPVEEDGRLEFTDMVLPPEPVFHQPARSIQHRPLRILTYRWHVPHQYELYKLNAEFTLVGDLGESSCSWWDLGQRPLPSNACFANWREIDPSQFDLAILHFDENVLHASVDARSIGADWGKTFRFLQRNLKIPRIAVCHGTPPLDENTRVVTAARQALVDFLGETNVVVNSYQAMSEWGFCHSQVIWQGFDPEEFLCRSQSTGFPLRILTLPGGAYAERPAYRGADLLGQVVPRVSAPLESLCVAEPNLMLSGNTYARAKFAHYIAALHKFDIYFNPTLHSPMPRSRGEAMLCGLTTVSADSHDVECFVDNGVNGYFSATAKELADQLNFLLTNPAHARKIGLAGRETAKRLFHIERYLADWRQLIRHTLGNDAI